MLDFAGGDLHARAARPAGRRGDRAEPPRGPVDDETLLALLGALLSAAAGAVGAAHLAAAKTYVEEHLTEPGLTRRGSPAGVGISERHLSRVFAASGTTVPQYVLGRRLAAGARPCWPRAALGVAEVAAAAGFGSAARFSHKFKERYGVRASDVLLGRARRPARCRSARATTTDPRRSRPSGVGVPGACASKSLISDSFTPKTVSEPSSSSPRTKMCVTSVRFSGAVTMKCRWEARIGERPVAASSRPTGPSCGIGYGVGVRAQKA